MEYYIYLIPYSFKSITKYVLFYSTLGNIPQCSKLNLFNVYIVRIVTYFFRDHIWCYEYGRLCRTFMYKNVNSFVNQTKTINTKFPYYFIFLEIFFQTLQFVILNNIKQC